MMMYVLDFSVAIRFYIYKLLYYPRCLYILKYFR